MSHIVPLPVWATERDPVPGKKCKVAGTRNGCGEAQGACVAGGLCPEAQPSTSQEMPHCTIRVRWAGEDVANTTSPGKPLGPSCSFMWVLCMASHVCACTRMCILPASPPALITFFLRLELCHQIKIGGSHRWCPKGGGGERSGHIEAIRGSVQASKRLLVKDTQWLADQPLPVRA